MVYRFYLASGLIVQIKSHLVLTVNQRCYKQKEGEVREQEFHPACDTFFYPPPQSATERSLKRNPGCVRVRGSSEHSLKTIEKGLETKDLKQTFL